jgi:NitT/TauT family transport system substrate-binding protein
MAHPEAYAALTTRSDPITAYMASAPFQERALKLPGIRKLVDSFEVLGGSSTFSVAYAKADFVEKNPKLVSAFMAAQRQAVAEIKQDLSDAIDKYIAITGDKTDRALMEEILKSTNNDFDIFPKKTIEVAIFMNEIGLLKARPMSWRDYFFATMDGENGG